MLKSKKSQEMIYIYFFICVYKRRIRELKDCNTIVVHCITAANILILKCLYSPTIKINESAIFLQNKI